PHPGPLPPTPTPLTPTPLTPGAPTDGAVEPLYWRPGDRGATLLPSSPQWSVGPARWLWGAGRYELEKCAPRIGHISSQRWDLDGDGSGQGGARGSARRADPLR